MELSNGPDPKSKCIFILRTLADASGAGEEFLKSGAKTAGNSAGEKGSAGRSAGSSAVACATKECGTAPGTPLFPGTVPGSPRSTFLEFLSSSPAPLSGASGVTRQVPILGWIGKVEICREPSMRTHNFEVCREASAGTHNFKLQNLQVHQPHINAFKVSFLAPLPEKEPTLPPPHKKGLHVSLSNCFKGIWESKSIPNGPFLSRVCKRWFPNGGFQTVV